MKNNAATFCFCLIALITAGGAINVLAQSTVTNGYVCDPKNPGGEETRLYYREQEGLGINISPTATFPIVCPVVIPYNNPPYEISLGFVNTSSSTQNFACALEENDVFGNKTRALGNSITAPALGWAALNWSNVYLSGPAYYLSLRCILPPKGAVSWLEWY